MQHLMEEIDSFVAKQSHEVIGHGYERFVGYLTVLGIFILLGCLLGVIPGFESPTAIPSVPLGCALVTWFYYHFQGMRVNGFGYVKNFMGPEPWLAILSANKSWQIKIAGQIDFPACDVFNPFRLSAAFFRREPRRAA